MTTLMTGPEAEAVRCDRCRLVWPQRLGTDLGWLVDDVVDLHVCPRCRAGAALTAEEQDLVGRGSSAAKRRLALKGPGSSGRVAA